MHPVMAAIKNALGYAKFTNEDVKDATIELVEQAGVDLQGDDYEPGTTVEQAMTTLNEALDSTDLVTEETNAAIKNADASDLTDEE